MKELIREGDRSQQVADVQARLRSLGLQIDDETGSLRRIHPAGGADSSSSSAEILVDGIVGPHTWSELVEASWRLGDRALYLKHPPMRGDDVAALQNAAERARLRRRPRGRDLRSQHGRAPFARSRRSTESPRTGSSGREPTPRLSGLRVDRPGTARTSARGADADRASGAPERARDRRPRSRRGGSGRTRRWLEGGRHLLGALRAARRASRRARRRAFDSRAPRPKPQKPPNARGARTRSSATSSSRFHLNAHGRGRCRGVVHLLLRRIPRRRSARGQDPGGARRPRSQELPKPRSFVHDPARDPDAGGARRAGVHHAIPGGRTPRGPTLLGARRGSDRARHRPLLLRTGVAGTLSGPARQPLRCPRRRRSLPTISRALRATRSPRRSFPCACPSRRARAFADGRTSARWASETIGARSGRSSRGEPPEPVMP